MKITIRGQKIADHGDAEPTQVGPLAPPIHSEDIDPKTALREHSDILLQILAAENPNSDLRARLRTLFDGLRACEKSFHEISKLIDSALENEELKDLDEDEVADVQNALKAVGKNLGGPTAVAAMLKDLEKRVKDDKGFTPVKHILPKKTNKELEQSKIKLKEEK